MPDYKQTTITGDKWTRCYQIVFDNPRSPRTPYVTIKEQEVIALADGSYLPANAGNLRFDYNPANTVNYYDPVTLETTGQTFTEEQLYLMLFSLYIDKAKQRDLTA